MLGKEAVKTEKGIAGNKFILKTPVIFVIYNRPQLTQKVFNEIKKAKPPKLLVIADGPRADRPEDGKKCAAARAIAETVDWECEIVKNYADCNLNCGKRPATGFDWAFSLVEEAIILEDDCLPHPSFFRFCQELLELYRQDRRVMTISGDNFQYGHRRTGDSYYFSRYTQTCGWATWRRVWKNYDYNISLWPEIRDDKWLYDIFSSIYITKQQNTEVFAVRSGESIVRFWNRIFSATYSRRHDWWDYQMFFASLLQHGLNIIPNTNLISNLGYGEDATHTKRLNLHANIPAKGAEFPLKHPAFMIRDAHADAYVQTIRYPFYVNRDDLSTQIPLL